MNFQEQVKILSKIIISEEFKTKQNEFLNSKCKFFENSEENKIVYTEIHNNYIEMMDKAIIDECDRQGLSLDLDLLTSEFE